jgi:phosphoglycolate phosphatase-like HAD superfamily hydrolase
MNLPHPPKVIIFDFDGVILDSAAIKLQAYSDIYAREDPDKLRLLVEHATYHGGITRRAKFEYYERELFGRSGDAESLDLLCERYFDAVYRAVLACSFIEGARELLEQAERKARMHVVSGTPNDELNRIVRERGLSRFFRSVHGAPATKRERFAEIVREEECAPSQALAIGDSMTEFEAARDHDIPFLGIVPPALKSPFPAGVRTWPTLSDAAARLGIK